MEVNECLRVRVGVPLFFVQPQRSIKEVLEACQCAPCESVEGRAVDECGVAEQRLPHRLLASRLH